MEMSLLITSEITIERKEYIRSNLAQYNWMHFPDDLKGRYEEITLSLIDGEGQIYGGLIGEICWNWLEIQYLVVNAQYRKQGYGRKLLAEAERIAKDKKCEFIKLDTLSFQALDFYKQEGFQVFGTIENAGRNTHYYMKKDI